jgi:hypothetical protein
VREFGHEEAADETGSDRGRSCQTQSIPGTGLACNLWEHTFDDEQPLPPTNAMRAIQLKDRSREEPTKSITNLLRDIQTRNSLPQLRFCIPRTKKVYRPGKEHSLCDTQNSSYRKQLRVSFHSSRRSRNSTPDDNCTTDISARPRNLRNDHITGDLEGQIPNEENGNRRCELLGRHVQIICDSLKLGRGEVLSVYIVQDVKDCDDGENDKVDLMDELAVEPGDFIAAQIPE